MRYRASIILIVFNVVGFAASAEPTGAELYKKQCMNCHGANGEGTKKFNKPLSGDLAIPQLAKLVRDTMPEDAPGSLSQADAEKVSAYIYDAFYSKESREKNQPPRIELARLTVPQYRQTVADVIESFRWRGSWDGKQGLRAEYYSGRNHRTKAFDRIDTEVRFDFGTTPPEKVTSSTGEFSVKWIGGLLAPETGNYQIAVETDQAFRLFVNDTTKPVIDAYVKSGKETHFVANMYLVGGRVYPLRLEWTKSNVGVDNSKKDKPLMTPAFVRLEWKPPHKAQEVIPERCLTSNAFPESFICSTSFPPDDRSYGWERGTSISKEWDGATTDAALETVGFVMDKLNVLAKTQPAAPDSRKKFELFCTQFAERAFRKPLTSEQQSLYIERPFQTPDVALAVKKCLILVLKSPRFLYREVGTGAEQYDIAARLAFALWDSIPDEQLTKLAAAGKLNDRGVLAAQADRMLNDVRAQAKIRGFFTHWLALEHAPDAMKDEKKFPGFNDAALGELRTSLELFIERTVWSEKSDYRELLTSDVIPLTGTLAKLYGIAASDKPLSFANAKLDPARRSGVITHPYLMAVYAAGPESSPIHRGVFIARGLLGVRLKPPPEAVTPIAPNLHPTLNTRERVSLQTKGATCMTCHNVINPLGFTLEQFDAVGRVRDSDNKKPIDAKGGYLGRDGKEHTFANAKELGVFIANSTEAQTAFVEQLFHHLAQQSIRAYGVNTAEELQKSFASNSTNMRKLMVEIAVRIAQKPRGD